MGQMLIGLLMVRTERDVALRERKASATELAQGYFSASLPE